MDHLTRKTYWEKPSPLPSGWDRRLDPRTGRVYYVDHRNRKTYWHLPSSLTNSTVQSDNAGSSTSSSTVRQSDLPSYSVENAVQPSDPAASTVEQLERLSIAVQPESPTINQPGEPSTSFNSTCNNSAINAPIPPVPTSSESASQPVASLFFPASASASQATSSGNATPPRPSRGESGSSGSTPTRSRPAPASRRSALEPDPMDEVLGPLPPDWERRISPSGARYFVNHRVS